MKARISITSEDEKLANNVSDLDIETHGYTEINFAAFAWLGISFSPRIKNIKTQCT